VATQPRPTRSLVPNVTAEIGLAVPGRPIGPWSRRTGTPQASATRRTGGQRPRVHAGYTASRQEGECSGHERSRAVTKNHRSADQHSRYQATLGEAGQSSSLPTSTTPTFLLNGLTASCLLTADRVGIGLCCAEEASMASPHPREDLPFSPADLVLRYSLEQRADYLGDVFESTVQHWQIEVVAEQFDGAGDNPVSWPVGWARVTIVARD
jgi:hypothetical protein